MSSLPPKQCNLFDAEEHQAIPSEANGGSNETAVGTIVPTPVPQSSRRRSARDHQETPRVGGARSHVPTVPMQDGPVPLLETTGPVPGFPLDALPTWLGSYCTAVADYLEVPTELCGMLALAVLSTALNGKLEAKPRDGWHEAVNLYVLVVAASAERKSPAYKFFYGVAHAWEANTCKRVAADVAASISEHVAYQKSLARAETSLSNAATAEEKAKAQTVLKEIAAYLADNPVSHLPRLFIDDTSSEKLAETMARFGGRMTLASPEGHGFFARAGGLYSRGEGPLDVFLKAHNGEAIQVDRIGRGAFSIARPALTLCLCLQPAVLRALSQNKQFRGTGLLARFLIAVPEPRVGSRTHETAIVSPLIRKVYEHHVNALLDLGAPAGDDDLPVVEFTEEAGLALRTFMKELEPRLEPVTGDLAAIADWGGKLAGQTARIATLLHCAEHAVVVGQVPQDVGLALVTMEKAIRIGRFLLEHARRAFGALDGGDETERALFVLRNILRSEKAEITRKDVLRMCRTVKAKELSTVLNHLADHGYLIELLPRGAARQRYQVVRNAGNDGSDGNDDEEHT